MKIIFAGTPHFAATALEALLADNYAIVAVLTQPDRPAGRGMQLVTSPVKKLAMQHGISVLQPVTLKAAEIQQQLATYQADVMVVAAYGLILPTAVLQTPRLGCLNIHASLLPRWRGAAPIQRAILAGDTETGITIMQMDEGLDTGTMLLHKACPISAHDTSETLHDKLAKLGAEAILDVLSQLKNGLVKGLVQDASLMTYAAKLSKAEAILDWTQSAAQLDRAIRAYNPAPVAHSLLNGTTIKIWRARISDDGLGKPGEILAINKHGIQVACGNGAMYLELLQRPNAKAMPATQFVQGFALKVGDYFGNI